MKQGNLFRVIFLITVILFNVLAVPLNLGLEDESQMQDTSSQETPLQNTENESPAITETTEETTDTETTQPPIDNTDTATLVPIEEVISPREENSENTSNNNINENTPIENQTEVIINETENNSIETPFETIITNLNDTNESISENLSIDNNESKFVYTDIDKINNESEQTAEKTESNEESNEIVPVTVYKDNGIIEVEYFDEENSTLTIEKEDRLISETEMQVTISSNEHFEDELRVYASLPIESNKENINIFWKEEKENLVGKSEYHMIYYDENDNGLIDRISWIVPHLSEQTFNIIIIPSETNVNSSSTIIINVLSPVANQITNATNPITFNFSVDYSSPQNLDCSLVVNGSLVLNATKNNFSFEDNLDNGNYNWNIFCQDVTNASINATTGGVIYIHETVPAITINSTIYSTKENVYFSVNALHGNNLTATLVGPSGSIINTKPISIGQNSFNSSNISTAGGYSIFVTSYNLSNPLESERINFSVASIEAIGLVTSITTTQNASTKLEISSPTQSINWITIDYNGDGIIDDSPSTIGNSFSSTLKRIYPAAGNYTQKFKVSINNRVFELNSNIISVTSTQDTESPKITFISPDNEDILRNTTVEFKYRVTDNVKINNCTLRVYNASVSTYNSWGLQGLVFPLTSTDNTTAVKTNIINNTEITTTLINFDNRSYSWEVGCYDNSSNYYEDSNYFSVNTQTIISIQNNTNTTNQSIAETYEYESEVKEMISRINNFMEKEKTMPSEEKQVIEDLNFINELKSDKNRLTQIDQDFKFNLKYITNPSLKEDKIAELIADIKEFRGNIPYALEVTDSKEYVKNSVDTDFKKLIPEYLNATHTKIDSKNIKNMITNNLELQNSIVINTIARKVSIDYSNGTREIILVSKELDYKGNATNNKVLEIFPEDMFLQPTEYKFITEKKDIISNQVFEFDLKKLTDKKIIYYLESKVSLDDINKIETVLFSDSVVVRGSMFTGLAIGNVFEESISLIGLFLGILILTLLILIVVIINKMRIVSWKREPNVRRMFELIEESRRKIRNNELETAKVNYEKMRQIYPVLPRHTKPYLYTQIKVIENAIDKRDILNLLREYESAKREFRKEDAIEIYSKISKIYLKLPKEIRTKVYTELAIKR